MLQAVEALIAHLEPVERKKRQAPTKVPTQERRRCGGVGGEIHRDLPKCTGPTSASCIASTRNVVIEERSGHLLELREHNGSFFVVFSCQQGDRLTEDSAPSQVPIDNSWAVRILRRADVAAGCARAPARPAQSSRGAGAAPLRRHTEATPRRHERRTPLQSRTADNPGVQCGGRLRLI